MLQVNVILTILECNYLNTFGKISYILMNSVPTQD